MSDTKLTPVDTGVGNTKTTPGKPHKNWFFTWNNYPDTFDTILKGAFGESKFAFQEEKGEQGTKHIQGCVSFKNARHFTALQKIDKTIHWEVCKSFANAVEYCTKTDTRNGRVIVQGVPAPKKPVRDPLDGKELHPWQTDALRKISGDPDPRKIHWYWETEGNTGKTSLAKHICLTRNAIYVCGKAADVKCGVAKKIETDGEVDIVIWDIPRTAEDYVSYSCIEQVKNGIFFSGKYESNQVIFEVPHILVFANFEPDYNKLSQDRWDVTQIQ